MMTQTVRTTSDGGAVEVLATIEAGEVQTGSFLRIPLNMSLNFVVKIAADSSVAQDRLMITLDRGTDRGDVLLVMAFNFENEELEVKSTGAP